MTSQSVKGTIIGIPLTNHFIATFSVPSPPTTSTSPTPTTTLNPSHTPTGIPRHTRTYKFSAHFTGPTHTSFPPRLSPATLRYTSTSTQLAPGEKRTFNGLLGQDGKITMVLDDGVVIDAMLWVDVPEGMSGDGTWRIMEDVDDRERDVGVGLKL